MGEIPYSQLLHLATPEIVLSAAALLVVAMDLAFLRESSKKLRLTIAILIASLGCLAAILALFVASSQPVAANGILIATPLTRIVQIALLGLTILILLLSWNSTFTEHAAEYVLLLLSATAGMMFLVASQDLLVIFISLELLSLSLYVLTGFDKNNLRSSEASLKYFLFGGISAALLLFGFSFLYGLSNSTGLTRIAIVMHTRPLNPLAIVAIVTTLIGLGFKVAAAPLHFWAPDVYQGAPVSAASFIASSSKVASFFLFFQLLTIGFAGAEGSASLTHFVGGWLPALILISALSMLLGNLVAIVQSNLRRLLAYSAVAHTGYMLLAIVAHTPASLTALLYYVVTYALSTLGIFAVLAALPRTFEDGSIAELRGLSRRTPFLSLCLAICILSLAGIPPLTGFFGKFYLFTAVLASNPGSRSLLSLVILAIAMSAVSLYYYLRVLKGVYVSAPPSDDREIQPPLVGQILAGLISASVLLLGCAPNLVLRWILDAVRVSGT